MNKSKNTERLLFDALDRLVAGNPQKTDGKVTQENIAKEAGVSRATFNRYAKVVQEYQRVKARGAQQEDFRPFTIEDKNRELQEANTQLRRQSTDDRKAYTTHLESARQEIMVLNLALKARDETIAAKDREIAHLKKAVIQAAKGAGSLSIVE